MIALENREANVEIAPSLGGSIMRYVFRGRDVLRPATSGIDDPLETSCFPLAPFANRIANAAFDWRGRTVRLKRNFTDHPHALHGHGWQSSWHIAAQSTADVLLRYEHASGDWPWPYMAQQMFELKGNALQISLSLRNDGSEPMPASLGLHPYFLRRSRTKFFATVDGVWMSDETRIPSHHAEPSHFLDLAPGARIADAPLVDHCHTGWNGSALVEQPEDGLRIWLSASRDARFLHVFTPPNADYFCAEPVTAMPDAVNRSEPMTETGLRVLAPGETFSVAMVLVPEELDVRV